MSPQAGLVLMEEIAPRLKAAIPRCVKTVGAEDHEELIQDAILTAARMLHNVEVAGKTVTPGNIAYYTILHMKSGRRSSGCGRTDVMSSGTQLDDHSSVLSFEEEVGYDPELDEPIRLGELLTCSQDDPSMAAGRNLDWEYFLDTHDYRYGVIVSGIAEGKKIRESGLGYCEMREVKDRLGEELREFMGDSAIADSLHVPAWRGNIQVDKEKAACRADRRRS